MKAGQHYSLFENDAHMLRKGIDELFATVRDYASSERFRELLNFTAHFKEYAPYNAMLIHIQNPGARFVLPDRSWLHRLPHTSRREYELRMRVNV